MNRNPRGSTLLEVQIALAVVAIAFMAALLSTSSMMQLGTDNHEQLVAVNVARQKLAQIQSATFTMAFGQFGPGSSSGKFLVGELQDGYGQYVFPVSASGKLDETVVDEQLGMPRDLNGDGVVRDTDVSTKYNLLPVRIHIQWTTTSGPRELNLNTMLAQLK